MMKRLKMRLLNWLVSDLFCGLTEDDVFKFFSGNKLWINGELVNREVGEAYRDEAIKIKEGRVWKELKKQLSVASNRRMFEKGKSADDMFFGKAMLYNLDLADKYLDMLSKIKY